MDDQPLVRVEDVELNYYMVKRDLKSVVMDFVRDKPIVKKVNVLKDISFEVNPGEIVCLGGSNGSGKSTLLYAICGKMALSKGRIERNGRLLAFLGGMPGVDPHKPGTELLNYFAYLHGQSSQEVWERMDIISKLSGLPREVIIEQPLYTYSKGMVARLSSAFPLCFHTDITLFDETWGQGDQNFLNVAFSLAKRNLERGCCYVIVSHANNIWHGISKLGGRFLILGENQLLYDGNDQQKATSIYEKTTKYQSSDEIDTAEFGRVF